MSKESCVQFLFAAILCVQCGARTALEDEPAPASAPNGTRFVGRWTGSYQALEANHPYCARSPNPEGLRLDPLETGCTAVITRSSAPDRLSIGMGLMIRPDTYDRSVAANTIDYHQLELQANGRATFVEDFVGVPDAGPGSGTARFSGVLRFDGEILVVELCWTRRPTIPVPTEESPVAIECRLRRVR